MKLRIRGDSLRFRLSQKEVLRLLSGDKISETVHFSPSASDLLRYSILPSEQLEQIAAHFENGEILIKIPVRLVDPWGKSDQVGIESIQSMGEGMGLRIVIEKDFQCLQPRPEEDESDNFPNPEQTATRAPGEATGN